MRPRTRQRQRTARTQQGRTIIHFVPGHFAPGVGWVEDSFSPVESWAHDVDVVVENETIKDYVSPYRLGKGNFPWQPVSHAKVVILPGLLPSYDKYTSGFGEERQVYSYTGAWAPTDYNVQSAHYCPDLFAVEGLLPPDVAATHRRRVVTTITEQVQPVVSLANFLGELKSGGLKSLLPKLRGMLKNAGGNWLWWNFAALPLVSDIKAFLTLVSTVNARLAYLKKVNGKVITVNYDASYREDNSLSLPFHNGSDHGTTSPELPGMWHPSGEFLAWSEYKLHAECRVAYDLDLQGSDVFLSAVVQALGLRDPAQVVWNAIPFSFVVDWIVNIGDWLESNVDTTQPFSGTIKILGSSHSVAVRQWFDLYTKTSNRESVPFSGLYPKAPYGSAMVTAYHRRPGLFAGGDMDVSGLTPIQLTLAAALAQQGLGDRPHTRFR